MGSERMWLRHFVRHRRTKRYRDFMARYKEFHPDDICYICPDHHEEIHVAYMNTIFRRIKAKGYKPLTDWTWEEAEVLMDELRTQCRAWLQCKTPGQRNHKFVSGP